MTAKAPIMRVEDSLYILKRPETRSFRAGAIPIHCSGRVLPLKTEFIRGVQVCEVTFDVCADNVHLSPSDQTFAEKLNEQ
ncbi:hypothetical protein FP2506_17099 [Fulvimarina pelagi HTCC2506]|uniref:Uncharacterized protein n=1 Tax=Fulvimarina pelagi HTCC2506 TaxID=314231 RepID=Q0G2L0_9HYPH|nr:hypothetical protein FP2506_17099 [Fulvimarina pelagi HTCC2506]